MLPAALRMRRSQDFAETIRRGARAGRSTLVVHCAVDPGREDQRIGFVVARSVGGAVVRNKVRRRLRGVVLDQRDALPSGSAVVVRALPPSCDASYQALAQDYASALETAARRAVQRLERR